MRADVVDRLPGSRCLEVAIVRQTKESNGIARPNAGCRVRDLDEFTAWRVACVDSAMDGSVEQIANIYWNGLKSASVSWRVLLALSLEKTMPSFNRTPDEPQPFGFKVNWL